MSEMTPEQVQYQKEYDAAAAELDAAASGKKPEAITEPAAEPVKEPAAEPAKQDDTMEATPDPLAEMQARLEKAEKALKDTQAWGTKSAQRLAEIERERQAQAREATRPAILDENPALAEAIRYVASDPAPQQAAEKTQNDWMTAVDTAHPGIFAADADSELIDALVAKRAASGNAWDDPLVAIRDITAEKLAHVERQVGKRFAIESAKQAEKTAMAVPAAGGGAARSAPDPQAAAVDRIKNMTDAEFAKEVSRVKGF